MKKIKIMINGLPGNVARTIAEAAMKDERFELVPYSLTGPEIQDASFAVAGTDVALVRPEDRAQTIHEIKTRFTDFMAIDYTHPTAVNANAKFYVEHHIPFVMGTTGGDRDDLENTVKNGQTPAVIAPNMAKQIVGFQAMMEFAATTFPGLFDGYTLKVTESHQQGKADTSGTAKAMVGYFNQLGANFSVDDIEQIRDPEIQEKEWQIPKAYLSGHGWHTYTLTSPDNTVKFEFKHNINGRDIYISGTLDAVVFLDRKRSQHNSGQMLFTMIDVLKTA